MTCGRVLVCLLVLMAAGQAVCGEVIDGWTLHPDNAADPLTFAHSGKTLHVLQSLGPVFVVGDSQIGPEDYETSVISVREQDGWTVMRCRAAAEDLAGDYTLKLKKCDDGAVELVVEGAADAAGFQCGNIGGTDAPFKQFYVGQRDMEVHEGNDGWAPFIYWPDGKLYFHAHLDLDVSHSAGYSHRAMPKQHFLVKNPPISSDTGYAVLTDGSRPSLHERYVIRAATNTWETLGPVTNQPSEYRQELAGMIFNDVWDIPHDANLFYVRWLKEATAGVVKFYTVIEQWGFGGFDDTLPDLYREPDLVDPAPPFGTGQQLKELVDLANTMGRTALRTNYMLVRPDTSPSVNEGLVKLALGGDGNPKWHSNFSTVLPLVERQDRAFHKHYGTTAAFSDQLSSGGYSGLYVNYDAGEQGAGMVCTARQRLREICRLMKEIHQGPLGSESYIADFQFGKYMDTGDFTVFAGDRRSDFTPEEKLRRVHELTTVHSMGLGYRHFFAPHEENWMGRGFESYFNDDEKVDSYRACEVLYGNGGYLFYYAGMRLVHALTECFTVGVAQRHYALQPVDFVKYGKRSVWKTLDQLIENPKIDSREALLSWFRRFHVRYANGCHVYVNRDDQVLTVAASGNRTFKLPQNGWLVYTEDGNLTAYTALEADPFFPSRQVRVDFCEDKARGIRYVNPRTAARFMDAAKPTVWLNGKVHLVLDEPNLRFGELLQRQHAATAPAE
ncbi:MAG: hypothetical protein GXY33_11080 [Phycisphaerae bacterium]|nr:hypothetical protein [Phycisphaerae bacterium]